MDCSALVVVLDTSLRIRGSLALRPHLRRFTHAGSAEAALEAIEKVNEHNPGLLPRIYLLHHVTLDRSVGEIPIYTE